MQRKNRTENIVDLLATIDSRVKKVHTQSLDISFNELLDMKINGEIDISPSYQRLFRWTEGARSRFIESLLLEMPVPPIYVVEEDEGKYLLIDGLQRISSYLHLRGHLEATHLDPPIKLGDHLKLVDCDIVPELNGHTFQTLGTALQIRLKRSFVRVEVVRKASDARFKYHMFKRLNTGGEILTPQQLRNCTIRLLDSHFNDFIIRMSQSESYKLCTQHLTQEQRLGAFDQELVLRFFALKNSLSSFKHDVADFMTKYMEAVSDPEIGEPFDYALEEQIFTKTFDIFACTLKGVAFSRAGKGNALTKGFAVYHFEAFTIGIQDYLVHLDPDDSDQMKDVRSILLSIKHDKNFIDITTGGGKNSPGPLKARIGFVQNKLKGIL